MFKGMISPSGKHAGVYEHDGEAGYFYICEMSGEDVTEITGALQLHTGRPDHSADDVEIRWDRTQDAVGLFVRDELWAIFNVRTGERRTRQNDGSTLSDIGAAVFGPR
jgi:hypothetical protein